MSDGKAAHGDKEANADRRPRTRSQSHAPEGEPALPETRASGPGRSEGSGPSLGTGAISQDTTSEESLQPASRPPEAGYSLLALVAGELAAAVDDERARWGNLPSADRATLLAAVGLAASTFLPFVGVPGDPWRPGLQSGGWVYWLCALWAVQLVRVRQGLMMALEAQGSGGGEHQTTALRRVSLRHLVCGSLATAHGVYLMLLYAFWTDSRSITGERVQPLLRAGIFVALFFAGGLAFSGLVRFLEDARRRRSPKADAADRLG